MDFQPQLIKRRQMLESNRQQQQQQLQQESKLKSPQIKSSPHQNKNFKDEKQQQQIKEEEEEQQQQQAMQQKGINSSSSSSCLYGYYNNLDSFYQAVHPPVQLCENQSDAESESSGGEFENLFKKLLLLTKREIVAKVVKEKKQLQHSFKSRFNQGKQKMKDKYDKEKRMLLKSVQTHKQNLDCKLESYGFRKWRDKVGFTLGVLNLILSTFILGFDYEKFFLYHIVLTVVLSIIRFFRYRPIKWQYYFCDFCYVANIIIVVFLLCSQHYNSQLLSPYKEALFLICYNFASGVLLLAVPVYNHALVFHSLDRQTSLSIHLNNAIIFYCLRWFNHEKFAFSDLIFQDKILFVRNFFLQAFGIYFLWSVLYYIQIFLIFKKQARSQEYTTSFDTLNHNGWKYKMTHNFGKKHAGKMYMVMHITIYLLSSLLALCMFLNFIFNTVVILLALGCSIFNGASYYMEYFAKKYELQLQQMTAIQLEVQNNMQYVEDEDDYLFEQQQYQDELQKHKQKRILLTDSQKQQQAASIQKLQQKC